ncbi:MAG: LLM class flavin-dependent oxidoreductase [Chloroflexi bacterium]|nr:LLM class flavin-dependent oxidoreductase [Chloroflexota bacterium]
MKFMFFVANQFLPHESYTTKIQECVEQVRIARDAGFDMVSMGQHFLAVPYQMPQPVPFAARLAAETGDMLVGITIFLLPLLNPVQVAEEVATLDGITGGRFVFGAGLGYREEEYASFRVEVKERVPRMMEALEVIKRLWTEDEVEFQGRFYTVPRVKVYTRPVQKPHPPIWIAANSDSAVARVGSVGASWIINPHATVTTVERQLQLYHQARSEAGHPMPAYLPMLREVFVDEDRDRAWKEAAPYVGEKYATYAAWGQDKVMPGQESFHVALQSLAKDRFIIGTPEDFVREVQRYEERLGVNMIGLRMQWPGMAHEKVLRQLELFKTRIIPEFRRLRPRDDAPHVRS